MRLLAQEQQEHYWLVETTTHVFSYPLFVYWYATAECTKSMGFDSSKFECYSIRLYIDIGYKGSRSERNLVQDFIQSILQDQIELDPRPLFAMDISGLYWLDDSHNIFGADRPEVPEMPSIDTSNQVDSLGSSGQGQNGGASGGVGPAEIIIPVFTFIFLALIWLRLHRWYHSRRKQQAAFKTDKVRLSQQQNNDLETGSVRTEPMSMISPTYSSSNPVDLDDIPLEEEASQSELAFAQEADNEPTVASLPPRPPGVPRAGSLKLKKRRKKKKVKKKVAALQRVNSRDNISVMPTVSESEDEGSEMGSEGDSVCASDDEGSSYDASSGCLTPARARSRTSSHASSPRFSPQDEYFNSDIEFVMEASDFPNLLDREAEDEVFLESTDMDPLPLGPFEVHRVGSQTAVVERRTFEIEPAPNVDPNSSMGSDEGNRFVRNMLPLPWLP
jgi:hypothetical protein